MSLESLLAADSMTVQRPASTADAAGGRVTSWPAVYSGVPCRVQVANADQRTQFEQLEMKVTHQVFTQLADIENGDRMVISDGRTLRVVGDAKRQQLGTIPTFFMVMAEQIRVA